MAPAAQNPAFQPNSRKSCENVPPLYRRREPEKTALHEIVRENLEPFLQYTRENYKNPLPKYVEKELRRYLTCGMLSEGFTRIRCPYCGKDMIVAFSCGSRTVCPSCAGRRMAASAMHLVDNVLPDCPLRQWVLSVPFAIRRLLSSDNKVFGAVLKIFVNVVETFYLDRAREQGIANAKTGMLTIMQRFGGSLNNNPHVHAPAIDGVYTLDEKTGLPRFHFQAAPTPAEMQMVAQDVRDRVLKMLIRRGLIGEETHESNEEKKVDDALEACRNVASSRGRFERIDDKGRAQQDLFPEDLPFSRRKKSPWAGDIDGFSVEAGAHFDALDRKGRERLIRYCLRPAISNERLMILRDGSIAYKTKYPMRRSKTHRVMTPIEAMARIASIVAPPRSPLLRYHGVLAANAKWRKLIVPLRDRAEPCATSDESSKKASQKPKMAKKPSDQLALLAVLQTSPTTRVPTWRPSTSYIPWADLLKRSFDFDVLKCPQCSGRMEIIAVITRPEAIGRILSHLSLPLEMEALGTHGMMACDISDEIPESEWSQISEWERNQSLQPDERGPPSENEWVEPP
jgi:hypothetical protein